MHNRLYDAAERRVIVTREFQRAAGRGSGFERIDSVESEQAGHKASNKREDGGRAEQRQLPRYSMANIRGETMSRLSNGTPVRVRDVSLSGLQLQLPCQHQVRAGATIAIGVRASRGVVHVIGIVAWVSQQRCGVRIDWDKTPAFAKTHLSSLICESGRRSLSQSEEH